MPAVQTAPVPVIAALPMGVPLRDGNGALLFRLDGAFDGASAWDLRHALEAVDGRPTHIVVDFSLVREFFDFGVAVLAHGLAQRPLSGPPVILKGLRKHQLRLFRYFGVEVDDT